MKKRARLTILEGSFEQGFPVILQISSGKNQKEIEIQVTGKLPPTPELWSTWQHWQQTYCQLLRLQTRIKAKPGQITNISDRELGSRFSTLLNQWLNQGTAQWQPVRDCLHRNVAPNDELEIIIQTNDLQLQQIPWHLWDFFTYYVHGEIALSTCQYQAVKSLPSKTQARVKILAILGHDRDLDIDTDRAYLEQLLPQAQIEFLVEPQIEELNDRLWETDWNILFFAGHSCTHQQGYIWLNQNDILSIEQLRYALRKAVANGLCLAIFNSCDGLGLARELADLQLGQIIVMRELVPDIVAQTFLKHFLTALAEGKTLYMAVRTARERLQKLETKYPYATWLPVIFQNPAATTPTLPKMVSQSIDKPYWTNKTRFSVISLSTTAIATAILLESIEIDVLNLIKLIAADKNGTTDREQEDTPETPGNNTEDTNTNLSPDGKITADSLNTSGEEGKNTLAPNQNFVSSEDNSSYGSKIFLTQIEDLNGDEIKEIMIGIPSHDRSKIKTHVVYGDKDGFYFELDLDNLHKIEDFEIIDSELDLDKFLKYETLIANGQIIIADGFTESNKIQTVIAEESLGLGLADDNSILNYFQKVLVVARERNGLVLARSNEYLSINRENDILSGNFGDNVLFGNSSNDSLIDVENEVATEQIAILIPKYNNPWQLLASDAEDVFFIQEDDFNETNGHNFLSRSENSDRSANNQPIGFDELVELPEIVIDGYYYSVETYSRYLDGEAGDDFLYGKAGNDFLNGEVGNDFLYGKAGNDFLNGEAGNDLLYGEAGDDLLYGGAGNDLLYGEAGDDLLYGEAGDDLLYGEAGDDLLYGLVGNQTLDGGAGDDFLYGLEGNQTLDGGDGNDTLYGWDGNQTLDGGAGNDYLDGMGGNQTLDGGAGNDTLYGWDGNQTLDGGAGNDTLYGWDGNQTLDGGAGNDYLDGWDGNQTLDGGAGNDTLYGWDGNQTLDGGAGDDTLYGEEGNDSLVGGAGNDILYGEEGNNILYGGSGNDTFVFNISYDGVNNISDFSAADDELVFYLADDELLSYYISFYYDNLVFDRVSSDMLTLGTAATTEQHRFIYDNRSGNLFYDRDGIGENEQIQLAQLGSNLSFEALLSTMSVVVYDF